MYKILIADDESIERKVLCKSLTKIFGETIEKSQDKEKSISNYSDFIQQNLMPVIRGEKWE